MRLSPEIGPNGVKIDSIPVPPSGSRKHVMFTTSPSCNSHMFVEVHASVITMPEEVTTTIATTPGDSIQRQMKKVVELNYHQKGIEHLMRIKDENDRGREGASRQMKIERDRDRERERDEDRERETEKDRETETERQ